MEEIIFERELRIGTGEQMREIEVKIYAPFRRVGASGVARWCCGCSIGQLHPEVAALFGVDGLDAFLNCLRFIRRIVERTGQDDLQVWWLEEGDVGGFPVLPDY